jgi:hypothetical protein
MNIVVQYHGGSEEAKGKEKERKLAGKLHDNEARARSGKSKIWQDPPHACDRYMDGSWSASVSER